MRCVFTFGLALGLAVVLSGCDGSGSTAIADIRYRVFEAPADVVGNVVPAAARSPVPNSGYCMARIHPADVQLLTAGIAANPGPLAGKTRTISWWPKVADSWSYAKASEGLLVGGGGAGFLGVRRAKEGYELRIEYAVTHSGDTHPGLLSDILYEGPAPGEGAVVFLRPFKRDDGTPLNHVIVFEPTNWRLVKRPTSIWSRWL